MLQSIDLTKRYEDGLLALDHVNFEVKEGEIFCLLGANGAGKTTTIKMIVGLLRPTDGTAGIGTHDTWREPIEVKLGSAKCRRTTYWPSGTGNR